MPYNSPMKKKGSSCMQMKDYKGKPSGLMMEGSALHVESKELEAQAEKASSKLEKETGFGTKGFGESKKVEVLGSKLTNVPTYDKSAEERGLEKGYKLLESSAKGEGPYVGETMEVLKKQYKPEQAKQKLMSTPSARSTYEADVAFEKATGGLTVPQTGPAGRGFVTRKDDVAFQPHTFSQAEFADVVKKAGSYGNAVEARRLKGSSGYDIIPGLQGLIETTAKEGTGGRGVERTNSASVRKPSISTRALNAVRKRQTEKVKEQKASLEGTIMKEQFRKKPKSVSITTKGLVNPMRK